MALTNLHSFSTFVFFCLIYYGNIGCIHAARNAPDPNFHHVGVNSLVPSSNCSTPTSGSAFGSKKLKVTSRYGPCSHIPPHKRTDDSTNYNTDNSKELFKAATNPFMGSGEYTTTIDLGTPAKQYTLMLDTGSDHTWLRCKPCLRGCESDHGLFDPSTSSSYSNGTCKAMSGNDFEIHYFDGSYAKGHWGCDTLGLEQAQVVSRFQFGCALDNRDDYDNFAHADGVLGLGKGDMSLVSQTELGKAFSYCLPPTSSSEGYLYFGKKARDVTSSAGLRFTPLLESPPSGTLPEKYQIGSYYYLELNGISVAGKKLEVSSKVFTSPGTIIDSGTVITRLPGSVYSALRSAFIKSMSKYPRSKAPDNGEELDTCYNVKGFKSVDLPAIVLHFRNNDVSLKPAGIVWSDSEPRNQYIWCLGFTARKASNDLTIIGSSQQRGLDVFYDLSAKRIGFGTKTCAN